MIKRIVVCGLGKLGSPIAASFANAGLVVKGYDLDAEKVKAINLGKAPVAEPCLLECIQECRHLSATTDPFEAVDGTEACIFVAPTPSLPDGSFDNGYLLAGIEKIAGAVGDRKYIYIIASTVTPGSCEDVLLPAIRKKCPQGQIVYKPELIALGTVMRDLASPDLALFGANDKDAGKEVFELYCGISNDEVTVLSGQFVSGARAMSFPKESFLMTLVEAELAKISLNCAITMKISFANQIGMVAKRLGANPEIVLRAIGSDSRIGPKSLRFGMPFGGPCFPRDCRMFQHVAKKVSVTPHLAIATDQINEAMLQYIMDSIPSDGSIGILGVAYKAGTSFFEDAAGYNLLGKLTAAGRDVFVHDPLIGNGDLKDTAARRTVIVTTDAPEYRDLEFGPDTFLIDPMCVTKTAKGNQ